LYDPIVAGLFLLFFVTGLPVLLHWLDGRR